MTEIKKKVEPEKDAGTKEEVKEEIREKRPSYALVYTLLIVLIALTAFNQFQIFSITGAIISNGQTGSATLSSVIPTGTPPVYGQELDIKYDDVSPADPKLADETIYKLAMLDVGINLTGADLERYINIASQISCEYCCGAQSLIFSDGSPACGCAHSYAMRGLAKYLITQHGSEFTDDQILEELGKWKTLFFPNQITQKAQILAQQGIELNYINLASNKYRGIEKGTTGGGMVGGC